MTLRLTFHPADTPPPAPTLRRVKWWGSSPQMTTDTYSVTKRLINGQVVAQFALIQVWSITDGVPFGDWSANTSATALTQATLNKIAALQPNDVPLQQKMDWLCFGGRDRWGSPLRAYYANGNWHEATAIKQINAIYAGNTVQVLETNLMSIRWQGVTETVPMCRIRTFQPDDWGATHATHPHLVHEVFGAAASPTDKQYTPKGRIFLPIICRGDAWVMSRWLE